MRSLVVRTPNFMIAGEQKAGTSYLQANLRQHPEIFMSKVKEPLFFQRSDYTPEAVPVYLSKHFTDARTESWVGEATALYFHSELALRRIKEIFGSSLRFIICLRHPTEKWVSLYLHNYRRGRLRGDEGLLETSRSNGMWLDLARHADACARLFDLFSRPNVCFLRFEALRANPSAFVGGALDFLGLKPRSEPIAGILNRGSDLVQDRGVLTIDADPPFDGQVIPRFTADDLMAVHTALQPDIDRTEIVSGLDLTEWRKFPYDFTFR